MFLSLTIAACPSRSRLFQAVRIQHFQRRHGRWTWTIPSVYRGELSAERRKHIRFYRGGTEKRQLIRFYRGADKKRTEDKHRGAQNRGREEEQGERALRWSGEEQERGTGQRISTVEGYRGRAEAERRGTEELLLPALCCYPRNRRCSGLQDGRSFTVDQTQLDETSHGLRETLWDTNTTKTETFSPGELKTPDEERSIFCQFSTLIKMSKSQIKRFLVYFSYYYCVCVHALKRSDPLISVCAVSMP